MNTTLKQILHKIAEALLDILIGMYFSTYDTDNDGKVSPKEMKTGINNLIKKHLPK